MINQTDFESIYEKYSPILYGVALQIISHKIKAEQILIGTFKKIFEHDIIKEKYPIYCIKLIRLTIKTAQDLYPLDYKENLSLGLFEKRPLLNQLVCTDTSLQDFCSEKKIDHKHVYETIKHEFTSIRGLNNEKLLFQNQQIQQLREFH